MTLPTVIPAETFLRRVLLLDAAACAAMGAVLLPFGGGPADVLGAPPAMLRGVGAVLLGCAAVIAVVATRRRLAPAAVGAVVVLNLVWVVASAALAAGAWTSLGTLGVAVDVVQAAAVLGFAGLEANGLRRLTRSSSSLAR